MGRMTCLFYLFLIISFLSIPSCIRAAKLTLESSELSPKYVDQEKTLEINVTYQYTGTGTVTVAWFFNGVVKIRKTGNNTPLTSDSRFQIVGQGSLQLLNTSVGDNGTFRIEATATDVLEELHLEFKVIIRAQPNATVTCNQCVDLNEGGDFTCLCNSIGGNPPPIASWSKDNDPHFISETGYLKKTLLLQNVSKNDTGTYKCTVKSHTLTDDKSVQVNVRYKPRIQSIRNYPNQNVAILGNALIIICKAEGLPEPNYFISHNGTKIKNDNVYIVYPVEYKHAGVYECFAKNVVGNHSKRFTLLVTEKTTSDGADQSNAGTEWYIIVVTLICGTIFGAIIMHLIMLCLRRRRNARQNCRISEPSDINKPSSEQTENVSTYQELGLRNMNDADNYQSLTETSKTDPSKKTYYGNEVVGYTELNKVRGNDNDNYQSLR